MSPRRVLATISTSTTETARTGSPIVSSALGNPGINILGDGNAEQNRSNHRMVYRLVIGCQLRHVDGATCGWHGASHLCYSHPASTITRCLAVTTGHRYLRPVIIKTVTHLVGRWHARSGTG